MNTHARLIGSIVLAGWLGAAGYADGEQVRPAGNWKRIHYPALEIPGAAGQSVHAMVSPGEQERFRVDVIWSGPRDSAPAEDIAKAGQLRLQARLHLADGKVIEPEPQPEHVPAISNAGGTSYDRMFYFPWGADRLDEAWVELRVVDRTYWLEVPYGFTREPRGPIRSSDPKGGPPVVAAAMKNLSPGERIVPWSMVEYDHKPIQNRWHLSFQISNAPEMVCKVELYQEAFDAWKQETPTTSAQLAEDGGRTLAGKRTKVEMPDPFRRVDTYIFPRYEGPETGRDWGTLTVMVDQQTNMIVIPSSLFKHGHAR